MNARPVKIETPWMVMTQARLDKGQPPYVVWAKSEKMIRYRFTRRYKVTPIKVTPCHWDNEKGYVENDQEQS